MPDIVTLVFRVYPPTEEFEFTVELESIQGGEDCRGTCWDRTDPSPPASDFFGGLYLQPAGVRLCPVCTAQCFLDDFWTEEDFVREEVLGTRYAEVCENTTPKTVVAVGFFEAKSIPGDGPFGPDLDVSFKLTSPVIWVEEVEHE